MPEMVRAVCTRGAARAGGLECAPHGVRLTGLAGAYGAFKIGKASNLLPDLARWSMAGRKRQLRWLRHYLVAVTSGGAVSGGVPSPAALHLYDLRNKLVAATMPLQEVRT